jgi:hypothetical protein
MTQVIIISNSSLESLYEQTMHYINEKYHNYPTYLSQRAFTEEEAKKIANIDGYPSFDYDIPFDDCIGKNVY